MITSLRSVSRAMVRGMLIKYGDKNNYSILTLLTRVDNHPPVYLIPMNPSSRIDRAYRSYRRYMYEPPSIVTCENRVTSVHDIPAVTAMRTSGKLMLKVSYRVYFLKVFLSCRSELMHIYLYPAVVLKVSLSVRPHSTRSLRSS